MNNKTPAMPQPLSLTSDTIIMNMNGSINSDCDFERNNLKNWLRKNSEVIQNINAYVNDSATSPVDRIKSDAQFDEVVTMLEKQIAGEKERRKQARKEIELKLKQEAKIKKRYEDEIKQLKFKMKELEEVIADIKSKWYDEMDFAELIGTFVKNVFKVNTIKLTCPENKICMPGNSEKEYCNILKCPALVTQLFSNNNSESEIRVKV